CGGPGGDQLAGRRVDLLPEPELPGPVRPGSALPRLAVFRRGQRGGGVCNELDSRSDDRAHRVPKAVDRLSAFARTSELSTNVENLPEVSREKSHVCVTPSKALCLSRFMYRGTFNASP